MTKKVVDVKSVVLAGAALGAGVTLAAVQQPNTVSAATISSEDQQRNLAQSQNKLQEVQTKYKQQKAFVTSAQTQTKVAENNVNVTKQNLSETSDKLNELNQQGNLAQTKAKINNQNQVVEQNKQTASQARQDVINQKQVVAQAKTNYTNKQTDLAKQQKITANAEQVAQKAQFKLDNEQKERLTNAYASAQKAVEQDNQDIAVTTSRNTANQKEIAALNKKLESATKLNNQTDQELSKAASINQQAQQAKNKQQAKVTKQQIEYDQIYGKQGKLANLRIKLDENVQYQNSVRLPYTLQELRDADDQSTDQNWAAIVKKSENAYHESQNQFKRENQDEDNELVNPKHLTLIQERQLSEYTMRIINNARQQLNLPVWTYGMNTQSLADDIAKDYDDHGRSNRQGHYVEGIVREANKHGLKINNNYIEDMYAFFAPLDKPITMTDAKRNLYDNLKGMLLGNVCNPGSNPEYHHANNFLEEDPATYALSLSNQKENDYDFVTTHFINVTSGQHAIAGGGTAYTGVADISKHNGGSWIKDPDADLEIRNEITQLEQKQGNQLAVLNQFKNQLSDLTNKAMNAELSYSSTKAQAVQIKANLVNFQTKLGKKQQELATGKKNLIDLKQKLLNDNNTLTEAKDKLEEFSAVQDKYVQDYQQKKAEYQKQKTVLDNLSKKMQQEKQSLEQMIEKQNKLISFTNEAEKAVQLSQNVLDKEEQHQEEIMTVQGQATKLQEQFDKQKAVFDQAKDLLKKEQSKLQKVAEDESNAKQNVEMMQKMQRVAEEQKEIKQNSHKMVNVKQQNKEKIKMQPITQAKKVNTRVIAPAQDHVKRPVLVIKPQLDHESKASNDAGEEDNRIVYLPIVNNNCNWTADSYNDQGQKDAVGIFTDSYWQILDQKKINGKYFYRILANVWVSADEVKKVASLSSKFNDEHQFLGIVQLINNLDQIPLLDANGNFTDKFIKPGTSWKVWAIKWIDGQEMIRLGTEKQWISIKYVKTFIKEN